MRESSTYQAILNEGREEAARAMVLRLGRRHLGEPAEQVLTTIENLQPKARLEQMFDKILDVKTWEELLADAQ